MKTVCVYCGSSCGRNPAYIEAAKKLGQQLAEHGIRLVYGGASIGIMGAVADAVLAHGGQVTGIIPDALKIDEVFHPGLTELHVVDSMHTRKKMMADLSDGFIAMPGGFGTMEELFEILTWAQLGFHRKPSALLNIANYYDDLITFIAHTSNEGFVSSEHANMLIHSHSSLELLEKMHAYQAPMADKRVKKSEL
ncbi:MAG: LOG family protein [bacterium]